jgi:hypothetical protein
MSPQSKLNLIDLALYLLHNEVSTDEVSCIKFDSNPSIGLLHFDMKNYWCGTSCCAIGADMIRRGRPHPDAPADFIMMTYGIREFGSCYQNLFGPIHLHSVHAFAKRVLMHLWQELRIGLYPQGAIERQFHSKIGDCDTPKLISLLTHEQSILQSSISGVADSTEIA